MPTTKYILSPQFEWVDKAQLNQTADVQSEGIYHRESGDILLLNPEIAFFIRVFDVPATIAEAVAAFANALNVPPPEVEPVIRAFAKQMLEREIIVPAKHRDWYTSEEATSFDEATPQYFKDFKILRPLSTDSPTGIFLAEGTDSERFVLKILDIDEEATPEEQAEQIAEFAHEFRILSRLEGCPGICPLLEYNEAEQYARITYFEGFSLRKRLQDMTEPLPMTDKLRIFDAIVASVAAMHARSVIHGDLHYSNVLLNEANDVRIIDFDLAVVVGTDVYNEDVLRGGVREFIPPERLALHAFESASILPDCRAEVFQLGVLGYFLFFEKLPFQGKTWKALSKAIAEHEPDFVAAEVPDFVKITLQKALQKKAEDRYPDGVALRDAWIQSQKQNSSDEK